MALGLVLDGLEPGFELVGVTRDLDGLGRFELGGEFLECLRGHIRHACGLVTRHSFGRGGGDVGSAD